MAKTIWVCSNCKKELLRWLGKCPNCEEFGTIVEGISAESTKNVGQAGLKSSGSVKPEKNALTINQLNKNPISRTSTGISELDRVLGGGLTDAEVVLFAGEPGAGKSTLSLRIAANFAAMGKRVLYSSGEEAEQQIGLRAKRMNINNDLIFIANETNLESLLGQIEEIKPDLLFVDSLQTIASSNIPGSIGSTSQGKEAAHTLTRLAKKTGLIIILINQILKSGEFSGSNQVAHIVDCALMLESDDDTPLKFLRASKNRFGDTSEVGVFQHSETGLEEVIDPSGVFMESNNMPAGAACGFTSEGIRQIPVEVQSLVSDSSLNNPRRQFSGVDFSRSQIVCAILDKFCKAKLFEKDVFISTVAGLKVRDPQADLAIAAAILTSLSSKQAKNKIAYIGELSLTGGVRGNFMVELKVKEALRLGFDKVIIPKNAKKMPQFEDRIIRIESISELPRFLAQ